MTSSIIASLSILNIWRRGGLTALDDDGDDDDDDDDSDDGSDVDLGVRFFTKIQDQIKNQDHQDFALRKETMNPKRDYCKVFGGVFVKRKKKEKRPMKKLPKCLVLSKSAPIQTLHTRFQPWLSNTELLIISHVWKGGICHWTFLFIWNWKWTGHRTFIGEHSSIYIYNYIH